MNSTFFAIFQIAENARFLELEVVKPVILCFLYNKKRGKWPFLNMVMRGLFFRKEKFFSEKRGFWPNFTVIVRGLFQSVVFFKEIPGVFANFHGDIEGVKKIPQNSGTFCRFQMNRWGGNFSWEVFPKNFSGFLYRIERDDEGTFLKSRNFAWVQLYMWSNFCWSFFGAKGHFSGCIWEDIFWTGIFSKKFRGFLPIFRLYMRGLFEACVIIVRFKPYKWENFFENFPKKFRGKWPFLNGYIEGLFWKVWEKDLFLTFQWEGFFESLSRKIRGFLAFCNV